MSLKPLEMLLIATVVLVPSAIAYGLILIVRAVRRANTEGGDQ